MVKKLRLHSYEERVRLGAVDRPHYAHCLYQGVRLAKSLGLDRVSVIEFGVATGNGLVDLEQHAKQLSRALSIAIEIFGFDTGQGLPAPVDYRDLPYEWKSGFYGMNEAVLRQRLKLSTLVLGDIRDTARTFLETYDPAPIAAVMIDVDFYSSTTAVLNLFAGIADKYILPRAFFYFDDVTGFDHHLYSDYSGERLAIREFNERNRYQKFSPAYYLTAQKVVLPWHHKVQVLHNFRHSLYERFVGRTIR